MQRVRGQGLAAVRKRRQPGKELKHHRSEGIHIGLRRRHVPLQLFRREKLGGGPSLANRRKNQCPRADLRRQP